MIFQRFITDRNLYSYNPGHNIFELCNIFLNFAAIRHKKNGMISTIKTLRRSRLTSCQMILDFGSKEIVKIGPRQSIVLSLPFQK